MTHQQSTPQERNAKIVWRRIVNSFFFYLNEIEHTLLG